MQLWEHLKNKLEKSKRKWKPSAERMPYRCAELFCEKCGMSMGIYDIVDTNLEAHMYCNECVKPYIKSTPYYISENMEIIFDNGNSVVLRYHHSPLWMQDEHKICYFNSKGRSIKVKGKKIYIN